MWIFSLSFFWNYDTTAHLICTWMQKWILIREEWKLLSRWWMQSFFSLSPTYFSNFNFFPSLTLSVSTSVSSLYAHCIWNEKKVSKIEENVFFFFGAKISCRGRQTLTRQFQYKNSFLNTQKKKSEREKNIYKSAFCYDIHDI